MRAEQPKRAATTEAASVETAALRRRVIEQTPGVFVTLLSILAGLVLSDLTIEARTRMHLWPLTFTTVRTWGQLAGNGTAAVSVWTVLVHLGVTRQRLPGISDTLCTFGPSVLILAGTTFVGRAELWPWLYSAGVYLITCVVAVTFLVRHVSTQPGAERFASLLRVWGPFTVLYLGAPVYLLGGFLDQQGWLPRPLQLALALGGTPASLLVVWIFFRYWRAALDDARMARHAAP